MGAVEVEQMRVRLVQEQEQERPSSLHTPLHTEEGEHHNMALEEVHEEEEALHTLPLCIERHTHIPDCNFSLGELPEEAHAVPSSYTPLDYHNLNFLIHAWDNRENNTP